MLQWLVGGKDSKAEALLDPTGIGVLSASCCNAAAFSHDEALIKNVKQALADEGLKTPIHFETITHAQSAIPGLLGKLNATQTATIQQLMRVFATRGMAGFPVLLIGGKVVSVGDVPSIDAIREKLRASPPAPSASGAAG
jgi:hypothetical protein